MKDYLSEIDERFPIRNSKEQKEAFRKWASAEAAKAGVEVWTEDNDGHSNLVFSDVSSADVIFTAHYDTPRRALLPNLMLVSNKVLYVLYHVGVELIAVIPAVAAAMLAYKLLGLDFNLISNRLIIVAVYGAVCFGLFYLIMRGPANRRNRNDNTSGTAAVMTLVSSLKDVSGAAFILFDDEEKGKKGSKAFANDHPEIKEKTLVINLDCVGNGDTYVFLAHKGAENDPGFIKLKETMEKSGLNVRFYPCGKALMNSDQKSFDRGVGVCACMYKKNVGYYTDRIHTARDTVADPEIVLRLADALRDFVGQK
ncbi:MAG: Zn-dependent exopeptidase M28 [Clostridiales bacterium]|nr:Zn-dependent exopeptidase M28 [Clostridiales bacterium]